MLEKTIYGVADLLIEYITDKSTARYLMALARIRVLQKRYDDAT